MNLVFISSSEIEKNVEKSRIIESVRRAFRELERIVMPPRQVLIDGENWWAIMPCLYPHKIFVTKIVNIIPSNRERGLSTINGIVIAFRGDTGEPIAVLDGQIVTAYRTAAMCTLVAELWSKYVDKISIIGTGYQATYIVRFFRENISFGKIILFNRSRDRLLKFIRTIEELGIDYEICKDLEKAHDADIIVESTTSREPVIIGRYLKRDRWLVISIGVSGPDHSTIDDKTLSLADLIIVDKLDSVRREVGDLERYEEFKNKVRELSDIVRQNVNIGHYRRVVFKSVGIAVLDLYTTIEILDQLGYTHRTLSTDR